MSTPNERQSLCCGVVYNVFTIDIMRHRMDGKKDNTPIVNVWRRVDIITIFEGLSPRTTGQTIALLVLLYDCTQKNHFYRSVSALFIQNKANPPIPMRRLKSEEK